MRASNFIFFLLFFCGSVCSSQNITIYGSIKDKESKALIANANLDHNAIKAALGANGKYSFVADASQNIVLHVTHVGYNAFIKIINAADMKGKDSLRVDIFLLPVVIELDPVNISAIQKPDTVVGSNAFFIQDFEFAGNNLLLLTTDRFSDAWSVQLADTTQKIILKCTIPVTDVLRLYKDFLGYINVICMEEIYRVKISEGRMILQQLPKKDFEWMIRPCIDTIRQDIYFSNYRDDYPSFSYFIFNRDDSTKVFVRSVVDKDLQLEYQFEYEFLKPKDKLYARKVAQEGGYDKHDVAAVMTDFAHSTWFTPLYAPMFVIRDTVLIFDHYSDKIYKYDAKNKLIDSVKISYHHPEKWREWRRQLLKDDKTSLVYGVFLKGGYTYLKGINTYSGNIESVSRMSFQFIDKIKVKDGYAYYVYRPFGSLQTKFLYRERLSSAY